MPLSNGEQAEDRSLDPRSALTTTAPPDHDGLARLAARGFRGEDLEPLARALEARAARDPEDAAAMLDLGLVQELRHRTEEGLAWQARALARQRTYRISPAGETSLRLLMFVAPGEIMANVPVQFLLEGSGIRLDLLFLLPGEPLPAPVPDHDLALVGIGESDASRALLESLPAALGTWPRPVLLDPRRIVALGRDRLWRVLEGAPGVAIPPTVRLDTQALEGLARGRVPLEGWLPGAAYPLIVRPVGSHAGKGLGKVDDAPALLAYLEGAEPGTFYLSPFVDYRGPDGLFRKYRVAMVEGRPFICHMALAPHWMIHYLNAGMLDNPARRAEEQEAFLTFDAGFARRHREGLASLHQRIGLEYFALDCAETPDGRLLIFEADTAMVVHAMDPPDLFPYKGPQMARVFRAFREMLQRRAGAGASGTGPGGPG